MFEDRIPVCRPFFCLLVERRTTLDADCRVLELEKEACQLRGTKFRHQKAWEDLADQWWDTGRLINGNPEKADHPEVYVWIKNNLHRLPTATADWVQEWLSNHGRSL